MQVTSRLVTSDKGAPAPRWGHLSPASWGFWFLLVEVVAPPCVVLYQIQGGTYMTDSEIYVVFTLVLV